MKVEKDDGWYVLIERLQVMGNKDEAYFTEEEMLSSQFYQYENLSLSERIIYNKRIISFAFAYTTKDNKIIIPKT